MGVVAVDQVTAVVRRSVAVAVMASLVASTTVDAAQGPTSDTEVRPMVPVTPTVSSQAVPDGPSSLDRWRGRWQRLPEAPIEARSDAATGAFLDRGHRSRLFIWGGRGADGELLADGAIYDVARQRWQRLPPSPLEARTDAIVRWDWGDAFIVWGGYDADGAWIGDGAGYEFKSRRWTMLPPSPLPATPGDFDGTLNGYVAIASDPADGSPLTAWLDMEEAESREEANDFGTRLGLRWSWSPVFEPPLPTGERYEVVNEFGSVATLISYPAEGYASSVEHEFDTSDTGYRDEVTLPITLDGASGHRIERFAWIGSGTLPGVEGPVTYGALSPLTRMGRAWRTTTPAPVSFDASASLVVSPRHIIEPEQLIAWDPTTARWLGIRPPDGGPRTGVSAGWLQGQLLLWGGTTPDGEVRGDGWAFDPWLGRRTVALPEQGIGLEDGCSELVFTPREERLTGAIDDPRVTWFAGTRDRAARIEWPPGYVARFRPRLEVVDPSGKVVAREGDRLRTTRYHVLLNDLHVCPSRDFHVRGSPRMLRWIGNDPGSSDPQQTLSRPEASSPFEPLWQPLDAEDIPFDYTCAAGVTFTTADLATASPIADVSDALATVIEEVGPQISDGEADWYVVRQTDDLALALAPGRSWVDDQLLERTDEGWRFRTGGSGCEPRSVVGDTSIGRWRLDPAFPAPDPTTQRLHVLGYLACDGSERAGEPMIHLTDDAALIAIPMRTTRSGGSGACLGPTKMTIRLPEPLGDRTLYDVGSLPIRGATEKLDIDRVNASGSGG